MKDEMMRTTKGQLIHRSHLKIGDRLHLIKEKAGDVIKFWNLDAKFRHYAYSHIEVAKLIENKNPYESIMSRHNCVVTIGEDRAISAIASDWHLLNSFMLDNGERDENVYKQEIYDNSKFKIGDLVDENTTPRRYSDGGTVISMGVHNEMYVYEILINNGEYEWTSFFNEDELMSFSKHQHKHEDVFLQGIF